MLIYITVNIRVWRGFLWGTSGVAYTDARNKNDSYKYTKGVSMGPGFGDWGNSHAPAFEVFIGDFRSDDKEYDWLSGEFK